jgi:hypothetical protein
VDDRPAHVAPPYLDQALRLQDPHGFADRGRAHPELGEQVLLPGQAVAFLQLSGEDVVAEPGRDDLGEPGLAQLAQRSLLQRRLLTSLSLS